jgi:hypothetical protein
MQIGEICEEHLTFNKSDSYPSFRKSPEIRSKIKEIYPEVALDKRETHFPSHILFSLKNTIRIQFARE